MGKYDVPEWMNGFAEWMGKYEVGFSSQYVYGGSKEASHEVSYTPYSEGHHAWLICYCGILKFLITFEQGAPHFYFSQDPTNYVTGLACT